VKGFKESYVKPGIDLANYQCLYIRDVDTRNARLITSGVFDKKATMEELEKLSKEMKQRFRNILGIVMPVKENGEEIRRYKAFEIQLKLTEVAGTDVITNIITGVYLYTGVTGAIMGMEGVVIDHTTKE
jgi:hypothetical protein